MKEIFVNLKRFDVPRAMGGVCPEENPKVWIEQIIDKCIELGIGQLDDMQVVMMVPEALVISAIDRLNTYSEDQRKTFMIGVEGIYREDVSVGGNFGALTTHLPAAAIANMGCKGVLVGHCEERRAKQNVMSRVLPNWNEEPENRKKVLHAVDSIIHEEIMAAFKRELNVVLCIGETAEERGEGTLEEVKGNVEAVLKSQLETALKGVKTFLPDRKIAIAYEPIWAIGPGKIPPTTEYIAFVSQYIKETVQELYGFDIPVVYGGGLKEENAKMISEIKTIDGGLVALTRFTGEIGFYSEDLRKIIDKYIEQ